jgi:hypothetical protein
MRPPTSITVASVVAEARTGRDRLVLLVEELNAFYARGALRLALAARDRDLVSELDGFLTAVQAGVMALVREVLAKTVGFHARLRNFRPFVPFPFARLGGVFPRT